MVIANLEVSINLDKHVAIWLYGFLLHMISAAVRLCCFGIGTTHVPDQRDRGPSLGGSLARQKGQS